MGTTSTAWRDAQKADIATYLNFDMVASPNYVIGVYDANESTHEAPDGVTIPAGSAQTEAVFTDYFDRTRQPWVDTEFSGRSDYQAFIENGIPASGLFTGADGVKTRPRRSSCSAARPGSPTTRTTTPPPTTSPTSTERRWTS